MKVGFYWLIFLVPIILLTLLMTAQAQDISTNALMTGADAPTADTVLPKLAQISNDVLLWQTKNLVPDPGFEDTVLPNDPKDRWRDSGHCNFSQSAIEAHSGTFAARMVGVNNGECHLRTTIEEMPLGPDGSNRTYEFACWVNSDLVSGNTDIQLRFLNAAGGTISSIESDEITSTSGTWMTVTGSGLAPNDAVYAQLRLRLSGSTAGSVWYDDCFVGLSVTLGIDTVDTPDPVVSTGLLTYTFRYTNTGQEEARNIEIVNTFDSAVTVNQTNPPPTLSNNIWDFPTLPANSSGLITVGVQVDSNPGVAQLVNRIIIRSDETKAAQSSEVIDDRETTTISGGPVGSCLVSVIPVDHEAVRLPGDQVSYAYFVTNIGDTDGQVSLAANSSQGWPVSFAPAESFALAAGSSPKVTATLSIPADPIQAISGTIDITTMDLTLTCDSGSPNNHTTVMTTTIGHDVSVDIASDQAKAPADPLVFNHTLTNSGNWTDTITLLTATDPATLGVTLSPNSNFTLGPDQTVPIEVTVTGVPPLPLISSDPSAVISITAQSTTDPLVTDRVIDRAQRFLTFLPTLFKKYCSPSPPGDSDNIADALIICPNQPPISGQLREGTDEEDVYAIFLEAGQTISLNMTGSGPDADLYLYPPGTTNVVDNLGYVASSKGGSSNEQIVFQTPTTGEWYINVSLFENNVDYTLTITVNGP